MRNPHAAVPEVRRPDAVVIDAPAALPTPELVASARGVVVLREPLADPAIGELVAAYVRGFEREDLEALVALLARDAVWLNARGAPSGRAAIAAAWERRLRLFDYARIAGADVVQMDRIERYELDQLGGSGEPSRPSSMRPGDLLVRAPVATPRIGGERLFGEALVFLLRREDGRLRIAALQEEDGP